MSLEDNAPTSANCGEATTSQAPPVPGGTQHWNVTGATTSAWPALAGEGNLLAGSAAGRGEGQHRWIAAARLTSRAERRDCARSR
jgi:hypothetical protein